MKPITNDTQPKVCKASKEQPLLQSLPQVVSHGCFLKDFSKEVQCSSMEKYEKKKEVLEKIKTKKLKSAEMILTVTNKKVEENVAKSLSKGFLFEENVVEEWSPHHTNYKPDLSRLYTHLDTPKTTVLKLPQQAKHYKRHMPCHLTPMKDGYENSIRPIPSTESFLLGVSNSEERLKHIPPYMFSTMSTDTLKYVPTNELKPMKKSYGWDEHVLSLISKSTADIIVKDFTTQNQHHLKRFLEKKARKEKETDETGSTKESDDSSTETTTTQEILDPTLDRIETASTQSLLHELNKVKPATKRYKNILQQSFPLPPNQWSNLDSIQNQPDKSALKKGIRKWVDYPKEVKEKELVLHHALSDNFFKTSEKINLRTSTKQRNNANLLLAVDEWRSKWLLEKKWQTKTFEEIKEAMKSINDHVRLTAVSAAGKVILDKRNDRSLDEDVLKEEEDEMIEEIKKLYNDKSSYVAVASAITLYSINRADHKATELLLDTVKSGAHSERWIAVQCLAEYGRHDDCVIVELLSHIKTDNDPLERKKVEMFLTKLSNLTDSIQYMLSEQLNSTSWKDRYSACQMLPVLSGTMRKDIANKLSYLTWHDWSKNVRMAAAVALGKTGNGKLVHNALCKYLKSPKTSQQIEALRTVSKLGIVTAQLTVPFLQCLNSCNDTVCQEAIRVVRHVGLFSDDVINLLISLATSDRSLKIKVGAIKTLGIMGSSKPEVRDCLLWALHYGKHPQLQEAACEAIQRIGLNDKEIIYTMQEMLVVEENHNVKRKVALALQSLGFEETCDDDIMTAVRERVKKLCKKNNMLLHVLADSKSELQMYLQHQQENVGCIDDATEASFSADVSEDEDGDDVIRRSFDTTLEAYRARGEIRPSVEVPTMQPPYIPYWTESNQSISFEKD